MATAVKKQEEEDEEPIPNMMFEDILQGENERGIPQCKFLDDISAFSKTFTPPAKAELLIGAFSQLHNRYKSYEANLTNRQQHLKGKLPELEKSLSLLENLARKREADDGQPIVVRYALADNVYARAELLGSSSASEDDASSSDSVYLWLGANVMLEYTQAEALAFLRQNKAKAVTELENVKSDMAFCRDQIVTTEVNVSRIYNWDVRRKRQEGQS